MTELVDVINTTEGKDDYDDSKFILHEIFMLSPKDLENIIESRELDEENDQTPESIAAALRVEITKGLPVEERAQNYAARKKLFGENVYPQLPGKWFIQFLIESLTQPLLIILTIVGIISIILGLGFAEPDHRYFAWIEGAAVLFAVAVVGGVSAFNNWDKERKFRKLNQESQSQNVTVIRGGIAEQIKTDQVLVGDIISLDTGSGIPADGLFVSGFNLKIDESSMTGEPIAVAKNAKKPFLLSGCNVEEGTARMIALAVGPRSEWGKTLAKMGSTPPTKTPLQHRLEKLALIIGRVGVTCSVLTFIILTIVTKAGDKPFSFDIKEVNIIVGFIVTAITLIVVAIPEGLPLAVTLSLAYSIGKMMKEKQLVRNVSACETMGAITTICSDKTGTLTENKMTVVAGYIGEKYYPQENRVVTLPKAEDLKPEIVELIMEGICTNSTAHLAKEELKPNDPRLKDPNYVLKTVLVGNKTEAAMLKFVQDFWMKPYIDYRNKFAIIDRKPFSSETKKMSTIIKNDEQDYIIHVKGASEIIVGVCDKINVNGVVTEFTKVKKEEILKKVSHIAGQGIRTICLAYQNLGNDLLVHKDSDLIFLCLLGIEDPLRKEVPDSVAKCKRAGIKVRMVTGDNVLTAQKISQECGIYDGIPGEYKVMEGPVFREIAQKTPELLPTVVRKLQVLARSSPEDKLTLVQALQSIGEVVAVTGDGTNDAPAMKAAAVGLAMGSGTQVAKEASDIIIQDDNFATIVTACKWGRGIYENIRKFLQFQLTVNVVALSLVLITSIGNVIKGTPEATELPLTAIQLLWVNLIMNSFAALGLATETPSITLLDRPPFKAKESMITPYMMSAIIAQSIMQLSILLPIYYFGEVLTISRPFYFNDQLIFTASQTNKTLVFNTFVFLQLVNEVNARKIYKNEWNILKNLHLSILFVMIWFGCIVGQVIFTELGRIPIIYQFLHTTGMDYIQWPVSLGIACFSTITHFVLVKPIHLVLSIILGFFEQRSSKKKQKKEDREREAIIRKRELKQEKKKKQSLQLVRRISKIGHNSNVW